MNDESRATASSEEEWDAVPDSPEPEWKSEVSTRLEKYRARRGTRRPRYEGTMSLDFDRANNRMIGATAVADEAEAMEAGSAETQAYAAFEAAISTTTEQLPGWIAPPEPKRDPLLDPPRDPRPPMETQPHPAWNPQPGNPRSEAPKLIEFPRLPTLFDMDPNGSELADPVADMPRILYVPEDVPTCEAPLMGIELEAEELPYEDELDLPLPVAPMGLRVFAALIDLLMVLLSVGVFLLIVLRTVPAPSGKAGFALVLALPALLWAIYQYLFMVHCGGTPGMQMADIGLASFDHERVGRRTRRARAIASMVSAFPLGLGLIWALLDDDTLCWHDRITRTYVVQLSGEPGAEFETRADA